MGGANQTLCGGNFYDSGGSASDFSPSEDSQITLTPSLFGNKLQVTFTAWDFGATTFDWLEIYDGNSSSSPLIGIYNGTNKVVLNSAIQSSASDGSLTFVFHSSSVVEYPGWEATLSCVAVCSPVISVLTSTFPIDNSGYIDICQGESITFSGSGSYPQSGTLYNQSDATSSFVWDFADGTTASGQTVTHTFNNQGGYDINLNISDIQGCENSNDLGLKVRVSTTPIFTGTNFSDASVCEGESTNLLETITPVDWEISTAGTIASTTFLPDGSGVSYTTSVTMENLINNGTVTSVNDISSICIDMEHSWIGDIDVFISCPNGTEVSLFDGSNASQIGAYLGVPIDDDADLNPGLGYNYCFTHDSPSFGVLTDYTTATGVAVPAGIYTPASDFTALIGCPLNGDWTIRVRDNVSSDNGYIFSWSIEMDPSLYSDIWGFTPQANSVNPIVWSGDGVTNGVPSTATPTTGPSQIYTLTYQDEYGCSYDTTLTLAVVASPTIDAGSDQVIDCNNLTVDLDGSGSSGIGALAYNWTTSDGNIVSGASTSTAVVDAAGSYTLTVSNAGNNCSSSSIVNVTEDLTQPIADAGLSQTFGCTTSTLTLDGSASVGNGVLSYSWSTSDGNISSGANTFNPIISSAGTYTLTVTDASNGCSSTDDVIINSNTSLPTVIAGIDKVIDCNNTSVILDGSASTGVGTLSYTWTASVGGNITTDELQSVITVDQPGTYTLTVFDLSSNCSSTDDVLVTLNNTPPVSDAGNDIEITCVNATPTLDGSNSSGVGVLSYSWSTLNGNFISSVNSSSTQIDDIGTYTLTVTDASNGCSSTDDVDVTLNTTLPVANAGSDQELSCSILTVDLDGSVSSGVGFLTYQWSTADGVISSGSATNLATVSSAGTYTLSVTDSDNGCIATDDVFVSLNNTLPVADAGIDQTLSCTVTSLTLDGSSSTGFGVLSYSWNTLDGNIQSGNLLSSTIVDAIGTYTLTVTDASNGCSSSDDVLITTNSNLPVSDAGVTQELNCTNITLSLDGSNSSNGGSIQYLWTTSDGNITSGSTTNTAIIDQPGTYSLNVLDNSNGCSSNSSVIITQNNTIPNADAGNGGVLNCSNLTLTLDGSLSSQSSDIIYTWTTLGGNIVSGSNSNTAIIDQPGSYTLTVSDQSNGCTAFDEVTISKNTSTPVSDGGLDKVITCSTSSVVLNGSNSTSGASIAYLWSTTGGNILSGSTTNSCTVDAIGTYTLRVTNTTSGCYTEDDVVVTQNSNIPTANAGGNRVLDCTNTLITLDGSSSSSSSTISYSWSGGPIVSGATTNKARINTPGTYTLTVSDASNGCSSTSDAIVTQNITSPTAEAGTGTQLSCVLTSTSLDGTGSSVGANYTYAWSGGNIVSGGTTLNPVVNQANTYIITVTDNSNGCSATDNVIITQDASVPVADAGSNEEITCSVTSFTLGGSTSSTGASIDYLWTTLDGLIDSDPTLATITVSTPGTYVLTVSDNSSGCASSDNVVVTLNNSLPVADAGIDGVLTCSILNLQLDGSASDIGATIDYDWSTSDGNMTSATNLSTVSIDQPGTYTLTVLNTDNGCSAFDDVVVTQNNTSPIADAGTDSQLDCLNSSYVIGGTSSTGSSITYDWTTTDGAFDSGITSSNPTVSTPGTYDLVVTDTDNDCFAVSQVVITEDLTYPIANAGLTDELNCNMTSLTIGDASTSSGANFTYLWTVGSSGNITSNTNSSTATIDAAGTYTLRVTNNNNGCFSTSVVTITSNTTLPIANAGLDKVLDCNNLSVDLDGLSSSSGANYTYSWTTLDGLIISGGSTNNALTSTAGTYTLTVTNSLNGCSETDDVTVTNNIVYPIADAGTTYELTCTIPTYNLDGSASDSGLDYLWTTLDGQIVSGSTTLTPLVDAAGTYTLEVTNNSNGCQTTADVIITQNTAIPVANAGNDVVINCTNPSVNLDGSLSSTGLNYTYTWTGGTISAGANSQAPTVSASGTYNLLVEDVSNGCTATDNVVVSGDFVLPTVDAGNSVVLDCINSSNNLSGSGDSGVNYSTTWTTTSGNIISGTNTFNPVVNLPGSYTLTIENLNNGCTNSDNVVVVQNTASPSVEAGLDDELTCLYTSVYLDGTGSATGLGIEYSWTGPLNGIISGANSLYPEVEIGGTYTLTVTNTVNGCSASDFVTITENNVVPTVNPGINQVIDCDNPVITLDGSLSSQGANLIYYWSITGGKGNILTDQYLQAIDVDLAGTYNLFIIDVLTFCYNEAEVDVTGDLSTLNLVVAPVTPTCEDNLTLDLSPFVNIQGGTYAGNGISLPSSSVFDLSLGAGIHTVDYTVVNPVNNCPVTEQIDIEILSNPVINFSSNITEGCLPLQVTLTDDNPEVADICVWDFGDGVQEIACGTLNHTFESSNCFDVSLTKTFTNGCSTTGVLTDYICVNPLPVSDFIVDNDKINSMYTKVQFTNYSQDATNYIWDFGDDLNIDPIDVSAVNPEHVFPDEEAIYNVSLVAISDKGCVDTSFVKIKVEEEVIYYIPNSFTPNGNDVNEVFKPVFSSGVSAQDYTLLIYNRWGQIVFESHDINQGWDGSFGINGEVIQSGSYIWSVSFKVKDVDMVKQVLGEVNLIK